MSILKTDALNYHLHPTPGKIGLEVTKPITNQYELTLAYSPGVAEPVLAIAEDSENAYKYTSKGNLVGVITNGTAILGLGNLGALASKPVMEGKAALFKILAGVDAFDIEVNETNPEKFIEIVKAIAPTFGAINLEDIKAPECFEIEAGLQNIGIPVIHDDQHGTAIVLAAGLLNACSIQGCAIDQAKVVIYGAGAAAIASIDLLTELGFKLENIITVDSKGVINNQRQDLNVYKQKIANNCQASTVQEAAVDANILIDLSGAAINEPKTVMQNMAANPIMFLLSNPTPAIAIDLVTRERPDALIATGRSDLPNQINNAVCFPFLFKGALRAKAKNMTMAMKIAAVHAIKELAKEPIPDYLKSEYSLKHELEFGREYIIPKPTDKRLDTVVTNAVANAAEQN